MKKTFLIALLTILLSAIPLNTHAQNLSLPLVTYGITEEGISYQVYGETLSTTSNSVTVTRSIVYNGNVSPSTSLSWTENIDGYTYSGTLRLTRSTYNESTNKTTAVYYGTL